MRCPDCNRIIAMSPMGIVSHYKYKHPGVRVPDALNTSLKLGKPPRSEVEQYEIQRAVTARARDQKRAKDGHTGRRGA